MVALEAGGGKVGLGGCYADVEMISIHAHFDGKVIVPDGPVDLPRDQALIVQLEAVSEKVAPSKESCLSWLMEHAVDNPAAPPDLAHQHDHYLYGSPKKGT
jgi:hypothetical protein